MLNLTPQNQIELFYRGLNPESRACLDNSSQGAFMALGATKSFEMIEKITKNYELWSEDSSNEMEEKLGALGLMDQLASLLLLILLNSFQKLKVIIP